MTLLLEDGINDRAASQKENFRRMQWAEQFVILSRMAGSLSDETKSPLAGIGAAAEVLLTGAYGPDQGSPLKRGKQEGGEFMTLLQGDDINDTAASLRENFRQMQWAEQLIILSRMAGSLSYEIKGPLAGIKAATEVLSTDMALSSEHRDVLQKVLEQIRKIEVVLKGFLNFAKPPKPHFVPVGLNNVLDATVGFAVWHPVFSSRKGNVIKIVKDYGANLPDIFADPIQLQQVFMNLLINSAEAMQAAGTITIHSSLTGDKRSVLIRLADTGHGIDDDTADKMFQPFFTTKAGGTGLGLAVTKEVIEQHGGQIRAVNNHDRGVSFTILIPIRPGEGEMTHDGAGPNNTRARMN